MPNETTDWPPEPSPREMIDWLGLFVAPLCQDQRNAAMYMAVRDALVQHFGMMNEALPATVRLRGAIASALTLVCSDGNSDVRCVVDDVIACIEHAGFSIVEDQPHAER